jgi:type II secretory pathway pseudopilin PulG
MADSTCPFCAEPIAASAKKCKACGELVDGSGAQAVAPPKKGTSVGLIIVIILVVCVGGMCLVGILASLLMPALMKAKQKANRTKCSNNLRQVALSMIQYADDKRFYPHVRGMRDLDGDATTSDTPKIARTLIWVGYMDNPEVFICPESLDMNYGGANSPMLTSPRTWFWDGKTIAESELSPIADGNADPTLDSTSELSYGWSRRGMNSNVRSTALISADRALRDETATDAMIGNHGDGWNVGQADGTVQWVQPPADKLTATDTNDPESGYLSIKQQ